MKTAEPDSSTYLTREEVEYVMIRMKDLEDRYFSDIPIDKDMRDKSKFIYNIPRKIYELLTSLDAMASEDDVFSPLFMLYPFLMKDPNDNKQRLYLERIVEMIQDESYGDNNIGDEDYGDE